MWLSEVGCCFSYHLSSVPRPILTCFENFLPLLVQFGFAGLVMILFWRTPEGGSVRQVGGLWSGCIVFATIVCRTIPVPPLPRCSWHSGCFLYWWRVCDPFKSKQGPILLWVMLSEFCLIFILCFFFCPFLYSNWLLCGGAFLKSKLLELLVQCILCLLIHVQRWTSKPFYQVFAQAAEDGSLILLSPWPNDQELMMAQKLTLDKSQRGRHKCSCHDRGNQVFRDPEGGGGSLPSKTSIR